MKISNPKGKWILGFVTCLLIFSLSPGIMAGSINQSTVSTDVTVQSGVLLAAKDTDEPQKEIPTYYKLLKQAMDQLFAVIESIANDKTLTLQQQQQKVEQFIMVVRWGPEKKDTFWAMDMQGKHLVNVYQPDLVGKDLSDYADPMGIKPFAEALQLVREKGEGFVNYSWPRYEGKMSVPHTAYVRLMSQWDIVYGTHVPTDLVEGYEEPDVVLYAPELQNQPPPEPATAGQTN